MNSAPLKFLCLDIEGGHGGSSRSLLETIRAVDRTRVAPRVVCRRGGWIEDAYRAIDVPCLVMPDIPRLTVLERPSRNALAALDFAARVWPRSRAFRKRMLDLTRDVDLVHCNHVSLFLVAKWLRLRRPALPITMHIRTQPVPGLTARWQSRTACRTCDAFVFISENERAHLAMLTGGQPPQGSVIFNPVPAPGGVPAEPWPGIPEDGRLKAAVLSTYSYSRGIDRVVDAAAALPVEAAARVLFVVAGDMKLSRSLPADLGRIGAAGGTLEDYAASRGMSDRFLFLGHVDAPERVLAAADVLLKPTRENNPWGRDILEAMAAGLPVASVGRYDRFVETGRTGLLQDPFDAGALAQWLTALASDREQLRALGAAARARATALCDPAARAADLVEFWHRAAAARRR